MKQWLVLIKARQAFQHQIKFEHYIEVEAPSEYSARFEAFQKFEEKWRYTPSLRKQVPQLFQLTTSEAIEI